MKTRKTKIMSIMMLGASLMLTNQVANAQSWNLTGNTNATNASKLGATTAGINLGLYAGNAQRLFINGTSGNVGIGTAAPSTKLHVVGTTRLQGATTVVGLTTTTTLKVTGGTPGLNKILRSDAAGLASWITNPVGTNATNRVPRWNGTQLVSGTIFDNGTNVGVGTVTPATKLAVSSTSLGGIATTGSFQIGETNTQNLVLDNNEVFSRNNGGPSTLFLQFWGGDMSVCQAGGTTFFNGPIGASGNFASFGQINTSSVLASGSTPQDNNLAIDNSTSARNPGISLWSSAIAGGGTLYGRLNAGAPGINVGNETGAAFAEIDATAFNIASDRRMKKDIVDIDASQYDKYMNDIRNIESATFRYNHETEATRAVPHLGVIAQSLPAEVQAHISETPTSPGSTRLGVSLGDMQGLLLVGVKAVDAKTQELEKKVEELTATVKNLENALASCCSNYSATRDVNASVTADKASLEQNNPNPFSSETSIHYYLPSNSTAVLKVMNLEGQEMLTENISKTGYGEVRISGSTMAAGTYTYTLLVNGKAVESKIMVLTK